MSYSTHSDDRNPLDPVELVLSRRPNPKPAGEGKWTDYGRELCRRARDILTYDF